MIAPGQQRTYRITVRVAGDAAGAIVRAPATATASNADRARSTSRVDVPRAPRPSPVTG